MKTILTIVNSQQSNDVRFNAFLHISTVMHYDNNIHWTLMFNVVNN
jgi:hypothetical protein